MLPPRHSPRRRTLYAPFPHRRFDALIVSRRAAWPQRKSNRLASPQPRARRPAGCKVGQRSLPLHLSLGSAGRSGSNEWQERHKVKRCGVCFSSRAPRGGRFPDRPISLATAVRVAVPTGGANLLLGDAPHVKARAETVEEAAIEEFPAGDEAGARLAAANPPAQELAEEVDATAQLDTVPKVVDSSRGARPPG